MKEFNADLHFHSPFAGGVSKYMSVPVIAEQAKLKGLQAVGTADVLSKEWFQQLKKEIIEEDNCFRHKEIETYFIVQVELQDMNRVHHVVFLPDFEAALELKEKLKGFGSFDGYGNGRPRIRMNAEMIAENVADAKGFLGPAHAFTPYFGVYAHYDSVQTAYGRMGEQVKFIELGLSADSYFADLIKENHKYNFLTASDSHSPWPHRIGREFIRVKAKKPNFEELKKVFERKEEREIVLNVGLNPKEGKYHETACSSCYAHYSLEQAERFSMRCPKCKASIKRGVKERIMQLASFSEETHPSFRPAYKHLLPLAEIIQLSCNAQNVQSDNVQEKWKALVKEFGNEINVLLDVQIEEMGKTDEKTARAVDAFRKGFVVYKPGGGGQYGQPFVCYSEKEAEAKKKQIEKELRQEGIQQKSLFEY